MDLDEFVDGLPNRGLGPEQVGNLESVVEIAKSFHRDASTFNSIERVFRSDFDSRCSSWLPEAGTGCGTG